MGEICDSDLTLSAALAGKEIPPSIRDSLVLVSVTYLSFDSRIHRGQVVIHRALARDIRAIFEELERMHFPLHRAVPISAYGWDDDASMRANNSSAFNYRTIAGTNDISVHAFGWAIDINPLFNPYTRRDGVVIPAGAFYDSARPGTVTGEIARIFTARGWQWGGDWEGKRKDWQHFSKRP